MIGIKISPFSSFGYEKMMKFIFILLFIDFALCDTLFFRPKSQGSNPDSNPVCPDQQGKCPAKSTCCKLDTGQYGCCPLPNAVCCNDHVHCCPQGFTCDVGAQTCVQGSLTVDWTQRIAEPEPLHQDVVCPGEKVKCPSGSTCCQTAPQQFGCCPIKDAVCCSDEKHCCPKGYVCNNKKLRCDKKVGLGSLTLLDLALATRHVKDVDDSWYENEAQDDGVERAGYPQESVQARDDQVAAPIKLKNEITCPDNVSTCPDATTCCAMKDGYYGCCPYDSAVCCSDFLHCCPSTQQCNVTTGTCQDKMAAIAENDDDVSVLLSLLARKQDVQCPDLTSSCPAGTTCCELPNGGYGCCPYKDAVCCSDHVHCCEHGDTCDVKKGTCRKNKDGVEKPLAKKLPAKSYALMVPLANYQDIVCPDRNTSCPSGNTCCPYHIGSIYGCCPMPNAVCCNDHDHCCPEGYTCTSSGECTKTSDVTSHSSPRPAGNPDFTISVPEASKDVSDATLRWKQANVSPAPNPICPDQRSQCPSGSTCCPIGGGQYGCCPFPQAVCCDATYCCEHGYRCVSGQCYKDGVFKMAATKTPALPLNPTNQPRDSQVSQSNPDYSPAPNPICPDQQSQCPTGSTCCPIGGGQYGCCPFPQAVCCDATYCCEHGYRCASGQCYKDGVFKMAATKTPALPLNPTNQPRDSQVSQSNPDYSPAPNPICPDQRSQCPSGSTCCPIGGGQYGCCPFPQAVCCDPTYCCEHGNRCVSGLCYKDGVFKMAATKTPALPLHAEYVDCTDPHYKCPAKTTCCKTATGFGCCPLPQAVCCSDEIHCCPSGYTCTETQCTLGEISIPWLAKVPAQVSNQVSEPDNSEKTPDSQIEAQATIVKCPDGRSYCEDGNTCCMLSSGDYGCCPLVQAVCCDDHLHCCPNGYTCSSGQCYSGDTSIEWFAKVPSQVLAQVLDQVPNRVSETDNSDQAMAQLDVASLIGQDTDHVICPDQLECPSGSTCCQLQSGDYGCCNFPSAVCCSDHLHCCPSGYTCDVTDGRCVPDNPAKGAVPWAEKIPASTRAPAGGQVRSVQCPDGKSTCPSGNTCCLLSTNTYGCCPLPNAVCCGDGLHCCPSGTTCDLTHGTCVSATLTGDIRITWHDISRRLASSPQHVQVSAQSVMCPGGQSACPDRTTCCLLADGGYGCCPYPRAVCCADRVHCCPNGMTCNLSAGRCDSSSLTQDIHITWTDISRRLASSPQPVQASAQDVICPDQQSECPDGNTCCAMQSGKYACCPLPQAVCCSDHLHCCPNGHTCDVSAGRCSKQGTSLTFDWFMHVRNRASVPLGTKQPAIPASSVAHGDHVICPDKRSQCPSQTTCCRMGDIWGCCPYPSAICCSDGLHCCPSGYTCNAQRHLCRAPSWSTSAVNKAPVDAMLNDVSQFLEPFLKEFEEE